MCPINSMPAFVQILAHRKKDDEPLFDPMVAQFADVARPNLVEE